MLIYTASGFRAFGFVTLICMLAWHSSAQAVELALKKTTVLGNQAFLIGKATLDGSPTKGSNRKAVSSAIHFRGVTVLDVDESRSRPAATEQKVFEVKHKPLWAAPLMPVKGALQVPVQNKVSVMYAPASLSKGSSASSSQGVYLLRNTTPNTSWFMGIESGEFSQGNGGRDESKSAHLGVVFALN